ncbi:MAG: sigma-70 family RNA polymerase sigma factor [Gemmatimonadales bacterium]|nr:sigma-70 family RNA polymerase sigma factor [Gemmatimonadales bacterium]
MPGLPRYDAMGDDDLVKRTLAGSASAFDALWARHRSPCRSIISQFTRSHDDTEDVLAKLHLRLHQRLDSYRVGTNFVAWVNRMARNLACTAAAGRHRVAATLSSVSPAVERDAEDEGPACDARVLGEAERMERTHQVVGALREMPPAIGAVAWLYAAGIPYGGIAKALSIPMGTVKSRVSAAKERLARAGHSEMGVSRVTRDQFKVSEPAGEMLKWSGDAHHGPADRERAAVMALVARSDCSVRVAAQYLGLTPRRVRQLLQRFDAGETAALADLRSSRRRPSRHLDPAIRSLVIELLRERYADLGPNGAARAIRWEHTIEVGHETVRLLMIEAGLWQPRRRRGAGGDLAGVV